MHPILVKTEMKLAISAGERPWILGPCPPLSRVVGIARKATFALSKTVPCDHHEPLTESKEWILTNRVNPCHSSQILSITRFHTM